MRECIISKLREVEATKKIVLNGVEFDLKLRLAADLKFLLIMYGLNAPNSDHSCTHCTKHKKDFGNVTICVKLILVFKLHFLFHLFQEHKARRSSHIKGCSSFIRRKKRTSRGIYKRANHNYRIHRLCYRYTSYVATSNRQTHEFTSTKT